MRMEEFDRPKRIPSPEEAMFEGKENHLFTEEEFTAFIKEKGFHPVKRGTFCALDERHFLYAKYGFVFPTQDQAEKNLAFIRFLTNKGILHPGTCWAVARSKGEYQLFGITRRLEVPSETDLPKEGQDIMVTAELLKHEDHKTILTDYALLGKQFTHPESHLLRWYRRLYPDLTLEANGSFDANTPLLDVLDIIEASHTNNWGRDVDGTLYPIDVEVVNLESEQSLVDGWAIEHEAEIPKLT